MKIATPGFVALLKALFSAAAYRVQTWEQAEVHTTGHETGLVTYGRKVL